MTPRDGKKSRTRKITIALHECTGTNWLRNSVAGEYHFPGVCMDRSAISETSVE